MTGNRVDSAGPQSSIQWQNLGWLWWLCGSGVVITAAAVLRFEPPDQIIVPIFNFPLPQTCWTRRWFGLSCPGCGLTRSFVLAANGDLGQALQMHPIGTLLFLLLVLQIPLRLYQAWLFARKRPLPKLLNRYLPAQFWRGVTELWLLVFATAAMFAWWAISLLFG